jgi:hypothetical protein
VVGLDVAAVADRTTRLATGWLATVTSKTILGGQGAACRTFAGIDHQSATSQTEGETMTGEEVTLMLSVNVEGAPVRFRVDRRRGNDEAYVRPVRPPRH